MKILWRGFSPTGRNTPIYLYTYIPIVEGIREVVKKALLLNTIETMNKAFEVLIDIVNLHNQNNSEIFGPTIKFR